MEKLLCGEMLASFFTDRRRYIASVAVTVGRKSVLRHQVKNMAHATAEIMDFVKQG